MFEIFLLYLGVVCCTIHISRCIRSELKRPAAANLAQQQFLPLVSSVAMQVFIAKPLMASAIRYFENSILLKNCLTQTKHQQICNTLTQEIANNTYNNMPCLKALRGEIPPSIYAQNGECWLCIGCCFNVFIQVHYNAAWGSAGR